MYVLPEKNTMPYGCQTSPSFSEIMQKFRQFYPHVYIVKQTHCQCHHFGGEWSKNRLERLNTLLTKFF